MANVYTVQQVNAYIKNMFSQDYMLGRIYVKGEVSNCKYHSSGHIYFSLKDASGVLSCILFKGNRAGLAFQMKEGQQVIVLGNVSTYERDGKYQLYAREIIRDGAGLLYEKFQALKEELAEMGMFDASYKREIPQYASRIGVVTAPTGAAIRDIQNVAARRNPYVQLLLYPALVQGEGAAASIVQGIHAMEKQEVDVLIIGRGGGSMEDLWAFNEEPVARAIFDCTIPVISAVGHETDTTIADYVADLRAPTPSAAAELAVYEATALEERIHACRLHLLQLMNQLLTTDRHRVEERKWKLSYLHPGRKLQEQQTRLAGQQEHLEQGMRRNILVARQQLELRLTHMRGLSPLDKLNRGFAYVENGEGRAVKSTAQIRERDTLYLYVTDGRIQTKVETIEKAEKNHD